MNTFHITYYLADIELTFFQIKHEYLRPRAYICLSLSLTSVISQLLQFSWFWPLSRYSCCCLGSLHPRNFCFKKMFRFWVHCIFCNDSQFRIYLMLIPICFGLFWKQTVISLKVWIRWINDQDYGSTIPSELLDLCSDDVILDLFLENAFEIFDHSKIVLFKKQIWTFLKVG